jgi:hypothetical protein
LALRSWELRPRARTHQVPRAAENASAAVSSCVTGGSADAPAGAADNPTGRALSSHGGPVQPADFKRSCQLGGGGHGSPHAASCSRVQPPTISRTASHWVHRTRVGRSGSSAIAAYPQLGQTKGLQSHGKFHPSRRNPEATETSTKSALLLHAKRLIPSEASKYPPAKPGALAMGPLKAAVGVADAGWAT